MIYFDGSTNHTTSYTYNNGNQLTEREVNGLIYSYGYDNNGNMIGEHDDEGMVTLRTFQWNTDNRLSGVVNYGTGRVYYTYDALGRRIQRYDHNLEKYTLYYYDGLTVIAEKEKVEEPPWDWKRIYTVGPGAIGNIFRISEKSGANWVDAYYHYDAIGNVALRTNYYGGIVEAIDQEAYGNVKVGSQSGYHLTTKEYDAIPELYYFLARWYDPILGIFISKSILPTRYEKSFIICDNNITNRIDVTGCLSLSPPSRPKLSKDKVDFSGFWMRGGGGKTFSKGVPLPMSPISFFLCRKDLAPS
jgi:RHS repeat-associated protein